MPRVGSSSSKTRGAAISHLPSTTFCWLPPERVLTRLASPGARTRRPRNCSSLFSIAFAVAEEQAVDEAPQRGERHVVADRGRQHEPVPFAILADEGERRRRWPRRGSGTGRARGRPRARSLPVSAAPRSAKQRADERRAPGAHQAADPEDLAARALRSARFDHEAAGPQADPRATSRAPRAALHPSALEAAGTGPSPRGPPSGR